MRPALSEAPSQASRAKTFRPQARTTSDQPKIRPRTRLDTPPDEYGGMRHQQSISSSIEDGSKPAGFLTTFDKSRIAYVALKELPHDHARSIAADALAGAGCPPPPFLDVKEDAKWWADLATVEELRAYSAYAFLAMPKGDRRDFLKWGAQQ